MEPLEKATLYLKNLRILLLISEDKIKFVNQLVEDYFILDMWAEPV